MLSTGDGFRTTHRAYSFPANIVNVQFTSAEDGWAAGMGQNCGNAACPTAVFRTVDGGLRWTEVAPPPQPTGALARVPGGPYYGLGTPSDLSAVLESGNGRTWRIVGHLPPQAARGLRAERLK